MSVGRRLVIASGNHHKIEELGAMLEPERVGLQVLGLDAFQGVPEIAETANTFAGNAELKARGVASWLAEHEEPGDTWVLADDSGICVDALQGAPGVYSARFAGSQADDAANNRRLVEELAKRGLSQSAARYVCVLALCRVDDEPLPGGEPVVFFEGTWEVEVRAAARGTGGFGYDPHAWLPTGKTVAELGREEKAAQSHRGAALDKLLAWVKQQRQA